MVVLVCPGWVHRASQYLLSRSEFEAPLLQAGHSALVQARETRETAIRLGTSIAMGATLCRTDRGLLSADGLSSTRYRQPLCLLARLQPEVDGIIFAAPNTRAVSITAAIVTAAQCLVLISANNETEIACRLAVTVVVRERAVGEAGARIAGARKLQRWTDLATLRGTCAHDGAGVFRGAAARVILWGNCTGLAVS
jgi:hypothetical protein